MRARAGGRQRLADGARLFALIDVELHRARLLDDCQRFVCQLQAFIGSALHQAQIGETKIDHGQRQAEVAAFGGHGQVAENRLRLVEMAFAQRNVSQDAATEDHLVGVRVAALGPERRLRDLPRFLVALLGHEVGGQVAGGDHLRVGVDAGRRRQVDGSAQQRLALGKFATLAQHRAERGTGARQQFGQVHLLHHLQPALRAGERRGEVAPVDVGGRHGDVGIGGNR